MSKPSRRTPAQLSIKRIDIAKMAAGDGAASNGIGKLGNWEMEISS
jgi:hypothetical protein